MNELFDANFSLGNFFWVYLYGHFTYILTITLTIRLTIIFEHFAMHLSSQIYLILNLRDLFWKNLNCLVQDSFKNSIGIIRIKALVEKP